MTVTKQQYPEIQNGWQLVPIKPTIEMLRAAPKPKDE